MAGMTDTAFRRLVKRIGGCGLVVTEMVSSEGLVRGIDRTLEYAEYTEEERPVSIQIFGGDPQVMADAAQIVEGMGADIVDVNMGCPVPKIAKHNAGCSLMREPAHAASVVAAMARAVKIPVTVKMRAGLERPRDQRARSRAGASRTPARRRSPCTAGRRRSRTPASRTGRSSRASRASVGIPVFGSGDCVEPGQVVGAAATSGVERRARRPRRAAQSVDFPSGRRRRGRRAGAARSRSRSAASSCSTTSSCCSTERVGEAAGFRHIAPGQAPTPAEASRPAAASAGSSTSFARSAPGTRRVSTTGRSCGSRSTRRTRSRV